MAILLLLGLLALRLDGGRGTINPIGAAVVGDGDSLRLAGERIRLRGIDAPEIGQTCSVDGREFACGRQARDALARLVEANQVSCEGWERDRYGRLLAVCTAAGVELNREQVSAGWAIAYGGYGAEERSAREARLGIWAGDFVTPAEWRVQHGGAAEMPHGLWQSLVDRLRSILGLIEAEKDGADEAL